MSSRVGAGSHTNSVPPMAGATMSSMASGPSMSAATSIWSQVCPDSMAATRVRTVWASESAEKNRVVTPRWATYQRARRVLPPPGWPQIMGTWPRRGRTPAWVRVGMISGSAVPACPLDEADNDRTALLLLDDAALGQVDLLHAGRGHAERAGDGRIRLVCGLADGLQLVDEGRDVGSQLPWEPAVLLVRLGGHWSMAFHEWMGRVDPQWQRAFFCCSRRSVCALQTSTSACWSQPGQGWKVIDHLAGASHAC